MMYHKRTSLLKPASAALLTAAVVLASASPASAGPFDPTYKGDDNSVHAVFDWVNIGVPWNVTEFSTGASSFPLDTHSASATETAGDLHVVLPNFIDPLPLKLMRLQFGSDGMVDAGDYIIDILAHDPLATTWNIVGGSTGSAHWHYIDIEIEPNPDWEEIWISGVGLGNFLTLEIDTVSLPEPASLSMLVVLGGLAMLVRRRR